MTHRTALLAIKVWKALQILEIFDGEAQLLLEDAVRAVNLQPGDGQRALEEVTDRGVQFSSVERLLA